VVRSEQPKARGRSQPERTTKPASAAGFGARKGTGDDRIDDNCRRRSTAGYPPKVGRATLIATALRLAATVGRRRRRKRREGTRHRLD